jgi:AraC-like DNA-binding protein
MPGSQDHTEDRDSGVLVRLAYQGLRELGIDADAVIEPAGINKDQLYNSQLRTSHAAQQKFWQAAEAVSGDVNIGLHLGEHMPLFKGQILEYLFFSSSCFGEGLQRMLNYQRLLSDAVEVQLANNDSGSYLRFAYPNTSLRHLLECTALVTINFFRAVSEGSFAPHLVEFQHSGVADCEEYLRVFGCSVAFEKTENRIHFDSRVLAHRSLHRQPELLSLHEQIASKQLANLELQDLIRSVQGQIAALLETGEVSVTAVAQRLAMDPRTLRNRLADADTSFSQVLNDYRHHLATKLLAKTDETIAEIVYLTGFSEPSTFYRAFKRWEDTTPIDYRNKH